MLKVGVILDLITQMDDIFIGRYGFSSNYLYYPVLFFIEIDIVENDNFD